MYKNAETATLEALKMQAIGITVTLHSFLQASDIERIKKTGKHDLFRNFT